MSATKLTKKLKVEYVRAKGLECPYCKSAYLLTITDSEEYSVNGGCRVGVRCTSCKAEWRDIYELVGIEESNR